jgi:hypothetical protein
MHALLFDANQRCWRIRFDIESLRLVQLKTGNGTER